MEKNSERIMLFSAFRDAMLEYFSLKTNPKEKKKKSTSSHRIALILSRLLPSFRVDIDLDGTDILIYDEKHIALAIIWSNTYLTEKERERASVFHKENNPDLTLAFSLLEDKDYLLIYRFEKNYLEYLHIDKIDFTEHLLKRKIYSQESSDELLLKIPKKKRKN